MRTHVALLRGVNVGGHNRVAMADLRAAVEAAGGTDAATYINSGNVVFGHDGDDADAIADGVGREVEARSGVAAPVLVLTAARLAEIAAANPYAAEAAAEPKAVHVVLRRRPPDAEESAAFRQAAVRAGGRGSPDRLAIAAGAVFLHTPAGLGRSVLAAELAKLRGVDPGTARNAATVAAILALLEP